MVADTPSLALVERRRHLTLDQVQRSLVHVRANAVASEASTMLVLQLGLPSWAAVSAMLFPVCSAMGLTAARVGRREDLAGVMLSATALALAPDDDAHAKAILAADAVWSRFLSGERTQ